MDREQHITYGMNQSRTAISAVLDDEVNEQAFQGLVDATKECYEKLIASGVAPVYAANTIVSAINMTLIGELLDPA